jgi:exonuclease III
MAHSIKAVKCRLGLNKTKHGDHNLNSNNLNCNIKLVNSNVHAGKALNLFTNVNESVQKYDSENKNLNIVPCNFLKKILTTPKKWELNLNLRNMRVPIALSITLMVIYLLLLMQTVEPNPGPTPTTNNNNRSMNNQTVSLVSYNCNGLGNPNKLKRLLNKVDPLVKKGGIILLQETHIVDTSYLKMTWKNNFISNCVKSNSAGVIILFNNQLKVTESFIDDEGRIIVAVLQSDEMKLIVSNAYYPNDHKAGLDFSEKLYLKILEMQVKFPDHMTICAGDYNVCMTNNDQLNRNRSKAEQLLAKTITENNKVTKLIDAYRAIHQNEGYTWKRGNCYSRLDHVFVSSESIQRVISSTTDWCFEKSDHAAVVIELVNLNQIKKGPGIVKVNTKILDDSKIIARMAEEIDRMMAQTDESWNPHTRLEFLKVSIRTIFSAKISEVRKGIRVELEETEAEINQLENLKIRVLSQNNSNKCEQQLRCENVETASKNLTEKLNFLREKLSKTMAFVSKAKWYEFGEKSNKFFLNLN